MALITLGPTSRCHSILGHKGAAALVDEALEGATSHLRLNCEQMLPSRVPPASCLMVSGKQTLNEQEGWNPRNQATITSGSGMGTSNVTKSIQTSLSIRLIHLRFATSEGLCVALVRQPAGLEPPKGRSRDCEVKF